MLHKDAEIIEEQKSKESECLVFDNITDLRPGDILIHLESQRPETSFLFRLVESTKTFLQKVIQLQNGHASAQHVSVCTYVPNKDDLANPRIKETWKHPKIISVSTGKGIVEDTIHSSRQFIIFRPKNENVAKELAFYANDIFERDKEINSQFVRKVILNFYYENIKVNQNSTPEVEDPDAAEIRLANFIVNLEAFLEKYLELLKEDALERSRQNEQKNYDDLVKEILEINEELQILKKYVTSKALEDQAKLFEVTISSQANFQNRAILHKALQMPVVNTNDKFDEPSASIRESKGKPKGLVLCDLMLGPQYDLDKLKVGNIISRIESLKNKIDENIYAPKKIKWTFGMAFKSWFSSWGKSSTSPEEKKEDSLMNQKPNLVIRSLQICSTFVKDLLGFVDTRNNLEGKLTKGMTQSPLPVELEGCLHENNNFTLHAYAGSNLAYDILKADIVANIDRIKERKDPKSRGKYYRLVSAYIKITEELDDAIQDMTSGDKALILMKRIWPHLNEKTSIFSKETEPAKSFDEDSKANTKSSKSILQKAKKLGLFSRHVKDINESRETKSVQTGIEPYSNSFTNETLLVPLTKVEWDDLCSLYDEGTQEKLTLDQKDQFNKMINATDTTADLTRYALLINYITHADLKNDPFAEFLFEQLISKKLTNNINYYEIMKNEIKLQIERFKRTIPTKERESRDFLVMGKHGKDLEKYLNENKKYKKYYVAKMTFQEKVAELDSNPNIDNKTKAKLLFDAMKDILQYQTRFSFQSTTAFQATNETRKDLGIKSR